MIQKSKKLFKFLVIFFVVLISLAIVAPSEEEKRATLKDEIIKIENEILSVAALDVEKNTISYKKLHEYYPSNKKYETKYLHYKKLEDIESQCRISSRKYDEESLINKSSYNNETNRSGKWTSEKEYITSSQFTGKNSFNMEIKFLSKYKCSITKKGVRIKRVSLQKI